MKISHFHENKQKGITYIFPERARSFEDISLRLDISTSAISLAICDAKVGLGRKTFWTFTLYSYKGHILLALHIYILH